VIRRFVAYGFVGWALEVAFTGMTGAFGLRDRRLRGHSYLWMLPIYGAGGLLLERLHERLAARRVPRAVRSLAYTLGIYGLEFGSASLLDRLIGDVPWRYLKGLHVRGYVEDSGEGRWTVQEAIDLDVPAPVITLSLLTRLRSRQADSFSAKVIAALRNEFGGHAVKKS